MIRQNQSSSVRTIRDKRDVFRAILTVMVAAGLMVTESFGAPVTEADAEQAVIGWARLREALGTKFDSDIETESVLSYAGKDGKGAFFVVNLKERGFVVTSGDTGLNPILAYSKDAIWIDDSAANPLLAMLPIDVAAATDMLDTPPGGIMLAAAAPAPAAVNAAKWERLLRTPGAKLASEPLLSVSDLRVDVLLSTRWAQKSFSVYPTPTSNIATSYKCFNLYTPLNRPCGCVATAGAQIMYYHKWPRTAITAIKDYSGTVTDVGSWSISQGYQTSSGSGYTAWDPAFGGTYDWDAMSGLTAEGRKAIGKLTRDVGLTCLMSYGASSSGSHLSAFYHRLLDQFGYQNAKIKVKPSEDDWRKGILSNLDAKLPVGVAVPGHALVADGYGYQDGTLYVHFNLGWAGDNRIEDGWDGNAWYAPPDLTSADSSFTSISSIVYNVYPPDTAAANCTIVSGRALDSSGIPISGITVSATDVDTDNVAAVATTDESGIYAFFLPVSSYTLKAIDETYYGETSVSVSACTSTTVNEQGTYTVGTGRVNNQHGVDLNLEKKTTACATPTVSPPSGTQFYGETRNVRLFCATDGAVIRYTVDGSEPTEESAVYHLPFAITGSVTVKAKAFTELYLPSETAIAELTHADFFGDRYPDTPENRALHWVEETEETHEGTGVWQYPVYYIDGRTPTLAENTFTPNTSPAGRFVTLYTTLIFESVRRDMVDGLDNMVGAKAAVCIGTNGNFQVFTRQNDVQQWLDVTGLTPELGIDYTLKLILDCETKRYTASVMDADGKETPLHADGETSFAFASGGETPVRSIDYGGPVSIASLFGSYSDVAPLFLEGDVVGMGCSITLTDAEAGWLNGFGDYLTVKTKVNGMSLNAFLNAYLLNLDIMSPDYSDDWGRLQVSSLDIDETVVRVSVSLQRRCAVQWDGKAAPINGRLEIYGGMMPGDLTPIQVINISDSCFRDGDEAECAFGLEEAARFFRAKIVTP